MPQTAPPPSVTTQTTSSQRPHRAARLEDRWRAVVSRFQKARGWRPRVEPFTGYGSTRRVRVLGRVLLASPAYDPTATADRRGWRYFFTAPASREEVRVHVGDAVVDVWSDRSGYLDVTVDVELPPGWHDVTFRPASGELVTGRVLVVADGRRLGVVSDIDDTTMVTAVPRPLLAAWNTFVRHSSARVPVPGMAVLYQGIASANPGTPFVYVSTGAWNTAANLRRFLQRNAYPPGPLLLTDWGPTNTGWFRSGREHKNTSIDRLVQELPDVDWLLIGDDGQHDPEIYTRAARQHPDHVAAIAIRQLTPTQQVLSHGSPLPTPGDDAHRPEHEAPVPAAQGPDGSALARSLAQALAAYRR
ncbi:phosphatase domain-containing protein [Cellulosimicrobium sp. PMB13]|uniref:App1 family protein n=1 Tax=Cellulosimicrobium sp. PMB13 TaxID=3120158 RepID=UPI003F4B2B9A